MEGGNSADPSPMLLSHGRPNPHHKWARMWIALPFSQQPVSVLSMAFNWLRHFFLPFSLQPNKTTLDKSLNHHCEEICGKFGPDKILSYWLTLNGVFLFVYVFFFHLFVWMFFVVWLIFTWFSSTMYFSMHSLIKEICMCFKLCALILSYY